MSNTLNIALLQTDLTWENPEKNRLHFSEKIDAITAQVDIIVLPEMFTSGFTMHPSSVAETMDGETMSWLKTTAAKKQSAITGSLVIKENDNYYKNKFFHGCHRGLPHGFLSNVLVNLFDREYT